MSQVQRGGVTWGQDLTYLWCGCLQGQGALQAASHNQACSCHLQPTCSVPPQALAMHSFMPSSQCPVMWVSGTSQTRNLRHRVVPPGDKWQSRGLKPDHLAPEPMPSPLHPTASWGSLSGWPCLAPISSSPSSGLGRGWAGKGTVGTWVGGSQQAPP